MSGHHCLIFRGRRVVGGVQRLTAGLVFAAKGRRRLPRGVPNTPQISLAQVIEASNNINKHTRAPDCIFPIDYYPFFGGVPELGP